VKGATETEGKKIGGEIKEGLIFKKGPIMQKKKKGMSPRQTWGNTLLGGKAGGWNTRGTRKMEKS